MKHMMVSDSLINKKRWKRFYDLRDRTNLEACTKCKQIGAREQWNNKLLEKKGFKLQLCENQIIYWNPHARYL